MRKMFAASVVALVLMSGCEKGVKSSRSYPIVVRQGNSVWAGYHYKFETNGYGANVSVELVDVISGQLVSVCGSFSYMPSDSASVAELVRKSRKGA